MLLLGDIASPDKSYSEQLNEQLCRFQGIFSGQPMVCNLEGLVCDIAPKTVNTPVLYNHSSVIPVLMRHGCRAVCLSNNHSLDMPGLFDETRSILDTYGIKLAGAGKSRVDAAKPAEFHQGDMEILLFNSTWHVLLQHRKNPTNGVYINTINEDRLIREVSHCRGRKKDAIIIIYLHWNFDLETLPFPVHRIFARSLIDNGADLVVGSHSHCVQGGERYKNGYIVYGLGNFFMPWNTYINGTIRFPELARIEMVFEWDPDTRLAMAHFFKYENDKDNHRLELIESHDFDDSPLLKKYSPYQELTEKDYLTFFKKNRRKKLFVPVFVSYNNNFVTYLQSIFTIWRIRLARLFAKLKLRDWNN